MSRIQTNVPSLLAQRVLNQNTRDVNQSLERLSTGFRINRGADDPSGLIASENLRSEKAAITAAIDNAERAEQVVNIAEGGLQEVNALLLEVQGLIGSSANEAGISDAEKQANQLEIDSIIQTIDRIASTTSFQGTKLLNGNYDFQTTDIPTTVAEVKVDAAKLEFGGTRDVEVLVTQQAQKGGVAIDFGAATLAPGADPFTFDVTGSQGSRNFTFASGTAVADIETAVNTFTEITGVVALASGNAVRLESTEFGSDQFVSVEVTDDAAQTGNVITLSGTDPVTTTAFAAATSPIRDDGTDIEAVINGVLANTDGLTARINSDFLAVEVSLDPTGNVLGKIDAATITGGGANFNLGPNVDILNQTSIGIGNVAARNLGTIQNGFLDELGSGSAANVVDGDLGRAQKIVNDSIQQVAGLRGRLGAFQKNTVGASIRSLGVAFENTSAAESSIRDTDFAEETSALTRAQVLQQSATSILSLANSAPQSALSLLQ